MDRVLRIERTLRDLDALDRRGPRDGDRAATEGPGTIAQGRPVGLTVIGVDKQTGDLENKLLANLLFELLLHRVQQDQAQTDVLAILGADRIGREKLGLLLSQTESKRIRVLLFFEHLRDDAIEIVGTGGATSGLPALGNHQQAKQASDFIGAEHKWVVAQQTIAASESLTQTSGREAATATSGKVGWPPSASIGRSTTNSRSYSEAFGQGSEYTLSEQLLRETAIAPEVLMGLPITGMIYVEVLPHGRRAVANVDCHPRVADAPRVAAEPRASARSPA